MNVQIDAQTVRLDLDDDTFTENTRAAYPLTHIPISKLTTEQALYHFISGYTAKVTGTEKGVTEPKATFSTCFGAPFMVHHPSVYAELLGEKIKKHSAKCWLVNTGWSGGPYGVGCRMKIQYIRAMLSAALTGKLDDVEYVKDPFFNLNVLVSCEGVLAKVLNPRNTWEDKNAYDETAKKLANMFITNFKEFEEGPAEEIIAAGPNT
jgi:phosphoenolpyruvate carboxykinase (ATP)